MGVYQPEGDYGKCIGQIIQSQGMSGARLNTLLQTEENEPRDLVPLLEGLIKESGHWGAKQVTADLATDSDRLPYFRQAGFSVLAKQRVYRVTALGKHDNYLERRWRRWNNDDISAIRSLYFTLVPPLIQPVEPFTRRESLGLVHYGEKGDLQAYADLVYGPVGVWVLPQVHPQSADDIGDLLAQLVVDLPDLNGRSVFFATRSYQPWVEQALADLSVEPGPEQALMVRYIALRQRVRVEFPFASLDNGKPEPTIPLAPIKNHHE